MIKAMLATSAVVFLLFGLAIGALLLWGSEKAVTPADIARMSDLTEADKIRKISGMIFLGSDVQFSSTNCVQLTVPLDTDDKVQATRQLPANLMARMDVSGAYSRLGYQLKEALPYYRSLGLAHIRIHGVLPVQGGMADVLGIYVDMQRCDAVMKIFAEDPFGSSRNAFTKSGIVIYDKFDQISYGNAQ